VQRIEGLYIVTYAVTQFTDSYGAPADRPNITKFFNQHPRPTNPVLFYVDGIPFGNFFAYSDVNFENAEGALWSAILDEAKKHHTVPSLPAPAPWTFKTTLGQIAGFLSYKVP
jgi:hypothetical protein